MSATRDKNTKVTFVYSNLYSVYRKGKDAAVDAALPAAKIIKAGDHHAAVTSEPLVVPKVSEYRPAELLSKRIARPAAIAVPAAPKGAVHDEAIASLRENLKSLNQVHERLRFMLKELEDLVK